MLSPIVIDNDKSIQKWGMGVSDAAVIGRSIFELFLCRKVVVEKGKDISREEVGGRECLQTNI